MALNNGLILIIPITISIDIINAIISAVGSAGMGFSPLSIKNKVIHLLIPIKATAEAIKIQAVRFLVTFIKCSAYPAATN